MATLRHELESVATRVPVAPVLAIGWVAVSVETLEFALVVASSHCSVMPSGGVKVRLFAHPPPKTSNVFATVVVIDGAVTELEAPGPLL